MSGRGEWRIPGAPLEDWSLMVRLAAFRSRHRPDRVTVEQDRYGHWHFCERAPDGTPAAVAHDEDLGRLLDEVDDAPGGG